MENTTEKKSFWSKCKDKIVEELIKSIFFIIVAIVAVYFWEKSKMDYGISFSKKIDIFSSERQILLDISEKLNEDYLDLSRYVNDHQGSHYMSDYTYVTNVMKIRGRLRKANLILINSMVDNDSIKICRKNIFDEGQLFVKELDAAELNNTQFTKISTSFDDIVGLYSKEITKSLK